jgi:hypothetical protein
MACRSLWAPWHFPLDTIALLCGHHDFRLGAKLLMVPLGPMGQQPGSGWLHVSAGPNGLRDFPGVFFVGPNGLRGVCVAGSSKLQLCFISSSSSPHGLRDCFVGFGSATWVWLVACVWRSQWAPRRVCGWVQWAAALFYFWLLRSPGAPGLLLWLSSRLWYVVWVLYIA